MNEWIYNQLRQDPTARAFYCDGDGCDNRPFVVRQSELDEAEGVIECEHCGQPCREMVITDVAETR